MRFKVTVVRGNGAPQLIELEAASIDLASRQAAQLSHTVLACRPNGSSFLGQLTFASRNAQPIDVAVFIEQLRDLLVAGLSVIEALDALRRGATENSGRSIEQLQRQLQTGQTLSAALAQDNHFPALLVALVRSSELTSDLPQTLARFLEHEKRVAEIRHRLISTAIYPLLVVGVGGLVLVFLFFYVMPRFARIFEGMAGDLPWSARAMVFWSQLLAQHGSILFGLLALLASGVALVALTPALRTRLAAAVMTWAPLRNRLHTYFLARWYRATGMLVTGGIPLSEALTLSNSLLPEVLRSAGQLVEQSVRNGLTPSAAHARAGMATPVAEQLMLAGERTGDLGTVLNKIAHFHEAEVSRMLEKTMRTIEPLAMVGIGLGVGLVVVLMYMPIFELASAIQ